MTFDSGVTPDEVRRAIGLDEMATDSLSDETAEQKIDNAENKVDAVASTSTSIGQKSYAVRVVAAAGAFTTVDGQWRSEFSELDVTERTNVRDRAEALRKEADEALELVARRSCSYVRRVTPGQANQT